MGEIHRINGHSIKDVEAHRRIDDKADRVHEHSEYLKQHQDISHLASKADLDGKANRNHSHDEYLTRHQDLSHLATKEELRTHKHNEYATKEDLENFNPGNIVLEDVITKAEFNEHIAEYNRRLNNTEYLIDQKISDLVDSAPEAMDTLKELADSISENRSIYDQYIQSMTEMINGKAEKDHEHEQYALADHTHGYSELGHTHEEYALADHDHKQYLTKHQDVSYLATNGKVNKLVTYLYNRLAVLEGIVEELGAEVPDGGDLPIDPNEPTDPEKPGEEPDIPFNPDEPIIPEGEKFLLEYTIEPNGYAIKGSSYYFLPLIYTTSDSYYEPTSEDVTLTLKDGTTTNNLQINSNNVEKISILYDKNIYRIEFGRSGNGTYNRLKEVLAINTYNIRSMYDMFYECIYLKSINTNNFFTNKVNDMKRMFYNCYNLSSLNVSSWDTGIVKNMRQMFYNCRNLMDLDVSSWNTSLNTDFSYMFNECNLLKVLNLKNWTVERASSLSYMFYNCSSLVTLDLSSWNISTITDLSYMFRGCTSLTDLNITNWDTTNVISMNNIFSNCSSLSSIIGLESLNVKNVTNMRYAFFNTGLKEINLTNWNVSRVDHFGNMFDNNLYLEKLDISTWSLDSEELNYYERIFADCTALKELNIYGFVKTNRYISNYIISNMLLNVNLDCVITIPNDETIIALFDKYYPEYTYVYQD